MSTATGTTSTGTTAPAPTTTTTPSTTTPSTPATDSNALSNVVLLKYTLSNVNGSNLSTTGDLTDNTRWILFIVGICLLGATLLLGIIYGVYAGNMQLPLMVTALTVSAGALAKVVYDNYQDDMLRVSALRSTLSNANSNIVLTASNMSNMDSNIKLLRSDFGASNTAMSNQMLSIQKGLLDADTALGGRIDGLGARLDAQFVTTAPALPVGASTRSVVGASFVGNDATSYRLTAQTLMSSNDTPLLVGSGGDATRSFLGVGSKSIVSYDTSRALTKADFITGQVQSTLTGPIWTMNFSNVSTGDSFVLASKTNPQALIVNQDGKVAMGRAIDTNASFNLDVAGDLRSKSLSTSNITASNIDMADMNMRLSRDANQNPVIRVCNKQAQGPNQGATCFQTVMNTAV